MSTASEQRSPPSSASTLPTEMGCAPVPRRLGRLYLCVHVSPLELLEFLKTCYRRALFTRPGPRGPVVARVSARFCFGTHVRFSRTVAAYRLVHGPPRTRRPPCLPLCACRPQACRACTFHAVPTALRLHVPLLSSPWLRPGLPSCCARAALPRYPADGVCLRVSPALDPASAVRWPWRFAPADM